MIPAAVLCHQTGSRARLRVEAMRDDADYFERVRTRLGAECDAVRVNPRTGSILLEGLHVSLAEVVSKAEDDGLFAMSPASAEALQAGELVPAVDRAMRGLFRGPRHWPAEMAALMLVLAVIQIVRGNFMAPAVSLLWYASEAMHWAELEASER
jgi:hypothetical protein